MRVSLRKANIIQNNINELIRSIEITDMVRLNEYQNVAEVLRAESDKASKSIARKTNLISALYDIRGAVSAANATSGIDEKLTKVACIDKLMALYAELTKRTIRTELTVLEGKADKMRKSENDRSLYYGADALSSGIATDQDIESARIALTSLKKDKQRLQDEILELNVRTEVVLSSSVLNTLEAENIL